MLSRAALLLLFCFPAASVLMVAQSPEALKYAPLTIMLVNSEPGTEGIVPMAFPAQPLQYVPTSKLKDFMARGGQPIRLGDLLSVLVGASETIQKLQAENARLQAENDKLWKVAMKDTPQPQSPPTVVIQQQATQPSPLERYVLLRSFLPSPPQTQNINLRVSNCAALPALCVGR